MIPEEANTINSLDFLQQPIHSVQGISASFWSLLAAVDQGWQVEQPVKKMSSPHSNLRTYYFVLTHTNFNRLCEIAVPESTSIEHFICVNDYCVNIVN
jgi:hypothetical protein